jgi:hypothetical protein
LDLGFGFVFWGFPFLGFLIIAILTR